MTDAVAVFLLVLGAVAILLYRFVSKPAVDIKPTVDIKLSPPAAQPLDGSKPSTLARPSDAASLFRNPINVDAREVDGEIYLDIETLRLSSEVPGGWSSIEKFGVAVAITWDLKGQMRAWYEQDVEALVAELKRFERIVTYNGERFDFKVLSGYTSTRGLTTRSFDVLVDLTRTLGHRVKLDDVASHTLGVGKNGDGLDAVRWWREGKRDLVTEYCKNDVELLVRLVAHGREHGHIKLDRRRIPVSWSPLSRNLTRKSSVALARVQGAGK